MLFRWLEKAIRTVEGARIDSETFESAYHDKYEDALIKAESQLGWPARKQATAYGTYQILGENLVRYHGLGLNDLERFLTDPDYQRRIAHRQFNIMLKALVKRRGFMWPKYILSMWNAGINYNETYTRAMRAALKRK